MQDKFHTTVRRDMRRYTMLGEYVEEEELCELSEVIVSCVGMNSACFERRSTMTRIVVKPEDAGSCSIKSMEMEFHGRLGMGSCLSIL